MIDYEKTYLNFSDRKLLDVLDRPGDYQPEAVAAAQRELSSRAINEQTISRQLAERETVRTAEETQRKEKIRSKEVRNRRRYTVTRPGILDAPEVTTAYTPFAWWTLRLVTGFMALICLSQLYTAYTLELYENYWWISEEIGYTIILLATLFICVAATGLLWFRRVAGWVLTVSFLTYCLIASLSSLATQLLRNDEFNNDLSGLIDLYTSPDLLLYSVFGVTIYSLPIWALSQRSVRTALSVTKSTAGWTLYASVMVCLTFLYFQYAY